MAAVRTVHPLYGVQYHVTDAHGNHAVVQQAPGRSGIANISIGVTADSLSTLSQQNITDLLTALTAFANTGILS